MHSLSTLRAMRVPTLHVYVNATVTQALDDVVSAGEYIEPNRTPRLQLSYNYTL